MIILIKLFLNSKLDLIGTVKFVKQLFRIQIQKDGKVLFWNKVKSRMEACYSELILVLNTQPEIQILNCLYFISVVNIIIIVCIIVSKYVLGMYISFD